MRLLTRTPARKINSRFGTALFPLLPDLYYYGKEHKVGECENMKERGECGKLRPPL